jgi:hypothetical protein
VVTLCHRCDLPWHGANPIPCLACAASLGG